jgi:nucleoside-diphosphate-sugar epimerase
MGWLKGRMIPKIKNKKIFITGGTGFIGSWIIDTLIEDNKIWCYDNCRRFSPKIKELLGHKNLKFIKGDILDKAKLKKSLPKDIDIVIHLAAIAGVSSYYLIPLETMQVNLIGTYNLLELLKDKKIELFMDFSTSEVYGAYAKNVREDGNTTQGSITDMRWTYSISKLASEKLSHCYRHKYGLPVVSIRPFNIYGPFQVGEGAIHIFVTNALKGKNIIIHGDGSQVRAWCYIEDFLDGVFRCIAYRKKAIGNSFNIGTPRAAVTILDLAKRIVKISGSGSRISFKKEDRTDIEYRVPDISKARKVLGFSPSIDMNEGLKRTIEWYRQNLH